MRLFSLCGPTTAELLSLILTLHIPSVLGLNFSSIPSPNLDLSTLGRVGFAGDFDAISLYQYHDQNETPFSTNGSQSLLYQMPNGEFATLVTADASIVTMCPFVLKDGTLAGIVVGGNFTSLGGLPAQGVALFNQTTGAIIPLPGLSGQVSALLCDQDISTVFVGGSFSGGNSTNAIAWVGMTGWANLPFAGFNGPVKTITKAANGNILFGGSFTGLYNSTGPTIKNSQVINLSTANISAGSSTSTAGFSDPMNIVCKESGASGPGETWLVEENTPGYWKAEMNFGYRPTRLRLWNTNQNGMGTKTFRFTAFPIAGIMNFTYTNPTTNANESCTSQCPLAQNSSYQDFDFVNPIGMSGFQIDISDWYGSGAGLNGIELFEDEIYAYAVSSLDEPSCAVSSLGSNATSTGPWKVTPSGDSGSEYLTAVVTGPGVDSASASLTFMPDIKQSGNYTVMIYTPGCNQTNSCSDRGISNITMNMASGAKPIPSVQIFQTNEFDKYDQIYSGYVDAGTDSFRPTVTVTPLEDQNNSITLVAHRVRFFLDSSSDGGLNGLFEYDPNLAVSNTDFSSSAFDTAGTQLNADALIITLQIIGNTTYVAGNFTSTADNEFENIFAIVNGNVTALPNKGLNAAVLTSFVYGDLLLLGGNFTDTVDPSTPGLQNIGVFDTSKQAWKTLGAGVNGQVTSIVPLEMNITNGQPEMTITINGYFSEVNSWNSNPAVPVANGFAIWVPSQNNWLVNLNIETIAIEGQLSTATNVTGNPQLLAGTIESQGLAVSDATELTTSGGLALNSLGLHIRPQQAGNSTKRKRAVTASQNITGVVVGLFDTDSGRNTTVLGGHFTAAATNGSIINNLAIVNSTSSGPVSIAGIGNGIDSDSTFLALATQGDTLYAGGIVTGTVANTAINGLVTWDLASSNFASPQPPALGGSDVRVNVITVQPTKPSVFVAGQFDTAGSLQCPSICSYENGQWTRPGINFAGNVSAVTWQGNTQLLVGGDLNIAGNATTLATYDTSSQVWAVVNGASSLPGPITALSPANNDGSQYWIAGTSTNGSAYLMKYDGTNFDSVGDVFGKSTVIRGLSVFMVTQSHTTSNLVDDNLVLLVTGSLDIPNFGNASAALYNGSTFAPFLLSNSGNGPGSISQVFTEYAQTFSSPGGTLKLGYVILIALACALALIFLIILAGILIDRRRRRKEGYRPAPQNYYEKTTNMSRVPPERLFRGLGQSPGPRV